MPEKMPEKKSDNKTYAGAAAKSARTDEEVRLANSSTRYYSPQHQINL